MYAGRRLFTGIHLAHIVPEDILPEGESVTGSQAKLTSKDGVLHVEVFDPDQGATVTLQQPWIPV